MFKKVGKKLFALLLVLLFTLNCFIGNIYASFEDGLIIPGYDIGDDYNSNDHLDYDFDYDYEVTPDDTWSNSVEVPVETNTDAPKQDSSMQNDIKNTNSYVTETSSPFVVNWNDMRSGPDDYIGAGGGTMTIVAEKPLRNILHYDGNIIDNIHIAKWVLGDPAELKYPAYCASPGLKGVAQNPDQQYKIIPQSSLSDTDKKVLAVLRAGYPFKSPAQLGVNSADDAYYATHAAVHTTIQNGDLSKWSIDSSDTDRNTKILNAMKNIYNEGNASPYTPPAINFELIPKNESAQVDDSKQWIENTYQVETSYPFNFYRFELRDETIRSLVDTGKVVVESNGSKLTPQLNINGVWDNIKAYKIPAGQTVTVKMDKATADGAGGANFPVIANICDVSFENTYSYLGEPTGLSGNWQRYAYTSVPFATDTVNYSYTPTDEPQEPDDPDKPSTSGAGSLVIEKLDYNTKQKAKDAVFHIKGVDPAIAYMNITVKASNGATVPTISTGKIEVSDGVIKLSEIPAGTYEITEVSPPPHYSVAVGQNSQSIEVKDDAEIHPKVIFENQPYGSLQIRKIDEDDGTPLAGVFFKVVNHTTGFEQTVQTDTAGTAIIENLPEGSYEITEIATRPDYILNDKPEIGEVDWGEETVVTMKNKAKPGIEILKIDAETSEPIAGVKFEIENKNTKQVYSETTDNAGKIKIPGVDEGWYNVTEVTPAPGYIANDEVYEIYAESGKPSSITIKNTKKSGITIEKVDVDGNGLEGVSFNIFRFGEDTPIPNSPITTGKDGTAAIINLVPGHYQVQEMQPLPGYMMDATKYDLVVEEGMEQNTKIQIVNKRLPDLMVKKVDTNDPDTPLSGAMFEVKEVDGQALPGSPYTTDAKGEFKIEDIDLGSTQSKKLMITEIKAPEGYNISDPATQYVTMEPDKDITLTFKNYKKSGIAIEKVDINGKGLEGVSFHIYKFGENTPIPNSPVTTGADGRVQLDNLAPGHYQVQELAALPGYLLDTKKYDLVVEEGSDKTTILKIVNKRLPNLTVKKVDTANVDKGLAGAVFKVTEVDGQALAGSPYTTGPDGTFTIENIDIGTEGSKKLVITEIQPPPGYNLSNPTVQYATMEPDQDILLTFSNAKLPELIIRKIDSQTAKPLAGAVFSVEKLEEPNKGFLTGSPFTTDKNGEIHLPNQGPGSYKIVEQKASPNYIIDTAERIINLKEGEDFTAIFENTKKPTLTVHKVDSITKSPLAGAEFLVTRAVNDSLNGETVEIGKYYSDANGRFSLNFVEPGWYRILETHPAAGYQEIPNYYQDVFLKAGEDKEITFENTAKSAIIIRKVDLETGEALPNIRFQVRYLSGATGSEGTIIGVYTTGHNGSVVVAGLKPGVYSIAELQADSDHILDDTIQTVTLADDNSVVTVEFTNQPKGGLLIKKMDAITKEPLSDVIFKITNIKGEVVGESGGEFRTDEKGTIYIPRLMGGFIVQEIKTKDGYILDNTAKTIYIDSGKVFSLEFFNQPENSFVIQKLDGATQKPLPGAIIKVMTVDDKMIGEYKTDESGMITIQDLKPATYKVQEIKAPDGYCLDDTVKLVHIEQNKPAKIELYNYQKSTIQILKKDAVSKNPLAGAIFKVTLSDGKIVGEYETDASGIATCTELEAGTYIVQEVKAPDGFLLNSKPQTVVIKENKVYSLEFYNDPQNGFLIMKMDGNTKEALADARFKVTTVDDKLIGEYRTDKNGMITINGLDAGTYKVIEIEAPKGYNLDDSVHLVHLKQNEPQKLEIYNYEKAAIQIVKKDSVTKAPLANATFKVSKPNGTIVGEFITDATGIAVVPEVKKGSYVIQEIKQPEGYILNNIPQTIEVDENKVYTALFYNDPLNSFVIVKMDGNTKEPLADATIRVTTVKDTLIGEYRTDASGMITINDILPGTYKVQEIKQPAGYVLDDTIKLVTIEQDKPQKLELFNYQKAALIIQKVDKVTQKPLEKAKFKLTKISGEIIGEYMTDTEGKVVVPGLNPGWYTVSEIAAPSGYNIDTAASKNIQIKAFEPAIIKFENYQNATLRIEKTDKVTGKALENVEFSITRSDGKTYGKYRTDKRGEINLENKLPAGDYLIRETETVKGYALDTNIRKVSLGWGADKLIEWENYPLSSLQIEKTDAENGKPIADVPFEVFDKNQKSIGKFTTDSKGKIVLDKMLAGDTTYYVQEIESKEGYITKTGKTAINTKWGKTAYLDIENTPILGRVKIHKVSADNNPITGILKGRGLVGAEFTIYDSDGKKVEVLTTDSQGYATSGKLRYGEYTMKETKSPLYFLNENETITFKIEKDGETVEIERENKSTILQTNVEKSGYKEVLAGDTIRYDLFNIQNKSVVPLNNFYLHESIPSDATRITRLFTGTYNQNLNYTIYYKTNKNKEFKILKDNLFSDRVYEIDCAKGLQGDEFVTDIKFEFGTVDVGFREVERPFLYCKVNSNLPNSYQFTNHAEVGGMYEMQKVKAEDNFTTKVFAPAPENRGKLPRTGY